MTFCFSDLKILITFMFACNYYKTDNLNCIKFNQFKAVVFFRNIYLLEQESLIHKSANTNGMSSDIVKNDKSDHKVDFQNNEEIGPKCLATLYH